MLFYDVCDDVILYDILSNVIIGVLYVLYLEESKML